MRKDIINVTAHLVRFQSAMTGELYEVKPHGVVINAKVEEVPTGNHPSGTEIVSVKFSADEKSTQSLTEIERHNPNSIIVGSVIAAQAFPGRILSMVPVAGFERVPPDQKRMRDDKFTSF